MKPEDRFLEQVNEDLQARVRQLTSVLQHVEGALSQLVVDGLYDGASADAHKVAVEALRRVEEALEDA